MNAVTVRTAVPTCNRGADPLFLCYLRRCSIAGALFRRAPSCVAAIFALAKSLSSRPFTIVYLPARDVVHGIAEHDALGDAVAAVRRHAHRDPLPWSPATQSRTWSMAALAAEAADDSPRASMIAAPRFCTVGMKVSSIHAWSLISFAAFWPSTSAWKTSGYCVAEWLPQIDHLLHGGHGLAGLLRDLRERAVVVQAHHRGEAARASRLFAFFIAMRRWCSRGCPPPAPSRRARRLRRGPCPAARRSRRWPRAGPCAPCPGRAGARRPAAPRPRP